MSITNNSDVAGRTYSPPVAVYPSLGDSPLINPTHSPDKSPIMTEDIFPPPTKKLYPSFADSLQPSSQATLPTNPSRPNDSLQNKLDELYVNFQTENPDNIYKYYSQFFQISYYLNQDPMIDQLDLNQPLPKPIEKENLEALQHSLTSHIYGFNPYIIDTSHPIHNLLYQICRAINHQKIGSGVLQKIPYLEKAITGILRDVYSELKAKGSVSLDEVNLLEIALRKHFFDLLLFEAKGDIQGFFNFNDKFPDDLDKIEGALHHLVTKNNFYCSPQLDLYPILAGELLLEKDLFSMSAQKAVTKLPLTSALPKNDQLIADVLKTWKLTKPSQCSFSIEAQLRVEFTFKIIHHLAESYKKQFEETGLVNQEQLLIDLEDLKIFQTGGVGTNAGRFIYQQSIPDELLINIFNIDRNNPCFHALKTQIQNEGNQQLMTLAPEKPRKFLGLIPFGSSRKTIEQRKEEIERLTANKRNTLDWVEQHWHNWHSLRNPNYWQTIPSAPPQDELTTPHEDKSNDSEEYLNDFVVLTSPEKSTLYPKLELTPNIPVETPVTLEVITPVVSEPVVPQHITVFKVQPLEFSARDPNLPMLSYVDVAFDHLLKGSDDSIWNSIPKIVQKDVLNHVHYHPSVTGKAEDVARRIFKNDGRAIEKQIKIISKVKQPAIATGLSEDFISKGEELLDLYYSERILAKYHNFITQFRALPKEGPFYQYVYEMAKAVNVRIESWDHNFAEYNWDQGAMLHLSVQALQRCIHTAPNS